MALADLTMEQKMFVDIETHHEDVTITGVMYLTEFNRLYNYYQNGELLNYIRNIHSEDSRNVYAPPWKKIIMSCDDVLQSLGCKRLQTKSKCDTIHNNQSYPTGLEPGIPVNPVESLWGDLTAPPLEAEFQPIEEDSWDYVPQSNYEAADASIGLITVNCATCGGEFHQSSKTFTMDELVFCSYNCLDAYMFAPEEQEMDIEFDPQW